MRAKKIIDKFFFLENRAAITNRAAKSKSQLNSDAEKYAKHKESANKLNNIKRNLKKNKKKISEHFRNDDQRKAKFRTRFNKI